MGLLLAGSLVRGFHYKLYTGSVPVGGARVRAFNPRKGLKDKVPTADLKTARRPYMMMDVGKTALKAAFAPLGKVPLLGAPKSVLPQEARGYSIFRGDRTRDLVPLNESNHSRFIYRED